MKSQTNKSISVNTSGRTGRLNDPECIAVRTTEKQFLISVRILNLCMRFGFDTKIETLLKKNEIRIQNTGELQGDSLRDVTSSLQQGELKNLNI